MAKLITLNFSGTFEKGFEITLRDEGTDLSQEVASLPSKPCRVGDNRPFRGNEILISIKER